MNFQVETWHINLHTHTHTNDHTVTLHLRLLIFLHHFQGWFFFQSWLFSEIKLPEKLQTLLKQECLFLLNFYYQWNTVTIATYMLMLTFTWLTLSINIQMLTSSVPLKGHACYGLQLYCFEIVAPCTWHSLSQIQPSYICLHDRSWKNHCFGHWTTKLNN